jgi:hypothetical protein
MDTEFSAAVGAPVELTFGILCRTVTVPEFQGHLANNALVFGISFLDTRIN